MERCTSATTIGTNDDLKYARCVSDCTKASNWTKVRVAASGPVGGLHLARPRGQRADPRQLLRYDSEALSYATCTGGCLSSLGWSRQVLDDSGQSVG